MIPKNLTVEYSWIRKKGHEKLKALSWVFPFWGSIQMCQNLLCQQLVSIEYLEATAAHRLNSQVFPSQSTHQKSNIWSTHMLTNLTWLELSEFSWVFSHGTSEKKGMSVLWHWMSPLLQILMLAAQEVYDFKQRWRAILIRTANIQKKWPEKNEGTLRQKETKNAPQT